MRYTTVLLAFGLLLSRSETWVDSFLSPSAVPHRRPAPLLSADHQNNDNRRTVVLWDADPLASSSSATTTSRQVQVRKRKDLKQFTRYLEVECWKRAELRGLEPVLQAVADACKQINRIVQRAKTDDIYGAAVVDAHGNPVDGTNIQGEVQQKLDVLCNTIMMRAFCGSSQAIAGVASEEEDVPRCCADVMVSTRNRLRNQRLDIWRI